MYQNVFCGAKAQKNQHHYKIKKDVAFFAVWYFCVNVLVKKNVEENELMCQGL